MKNKVAVIGLGYTGAPLAFSFAKKFNVVGYDLNKKRIKELNENTDSNNQISLKQFKSSKKKILLTSNHKHLEKCNFYIIAVPTPVKKNNEPDLLQLINATKTVARYISKKSHIVYESTVYPGVTEDICIPIIEKISKLKINKDFYCGFSPERINPGDKKHSFEKINKVVSSSNKSSLNKISKLYKSVIKAKIIKATSIKSAEAAKIIENTQRDVNIALINEFSIICKLLNLKVTEVLRLAGTKWNFINFKPGLVGGHCIGVDPFYLSYKSKQLGHKPKMIDSGRSVNDNMSNYLAKYIKHYSEKISKNPKILILGFTFKENCSDFRNTKVLDLYNKIKTFTKNINVFDPEVDVKLVLNKVGIKIHKNIPKKKYDIIFIAVPHNKFKKYSKRYYLSFLNKRGLILDFKNIIKFRENVIKF